MSRKQVIQALHDAWGLSFFVFISLQVFAHSNMKRSSSHCSKTSLRWKKLAQRSKEVRHVCMISQSISQACFRLQCPLTLLENQNDLRLVCLPPMICLFTSILQWRKKWIVDALRHFYAELDDAKLECLLDNVFEKCLTMSFLVIAPLFFAKSVLPSVLHLWIKNEFLFFHSRFFNAQIFNFKEMNGWQKWPCFFVFLVCIAGLSVTCYIWKREKDYLDQKYVPQETWNLCDWEIYNDTVRQNQNVCQQDFLAANKGNANMSLECDKECSSRMKMVSRVYCWFPCVVAITGILMIVSLIVIVKSLLVIVMHEPTVIPLSKC